jgi:hypothetical protein
MNPVYVPTKYEAYLQTEQFDRIRQAVFNRDGRKCVICGSTKILQAHHLTYRNLYHEDTGDLITLCRACHSIYHAVEKRRDAVEAAYQFEDELEKARQQKEYDARADAYKAEEERISHESELITQEIKEQYLQKDYCKNGDLDMIAWEVLNPIIEKKCKEHGIAYWRGNKMELRSYFLYRRCELLLRCLNRGYSYEKVRNRTKFDPNWLWKWYRKDKREAKLNEEKELQELNKED